MIDSKLRARPATLTISGPGMTFCGTKSPRSSEMMRTVMLMNDMKELLELVIRLYWERKVVMTASMGSVLC